MNPITQHLEFGGALGSVFMILSLPVTVLGLYATCNSGGCPAIPVLLDDLNIYGVLAPFGWFLWQLILYQVFPGETAQGTLLRDGSRRNYKINAWYCFQATILVAGYMTYEFDLKPWIWIADQYFSLAVGSGSFFRGGTD